LTEPTAGAQPWPRESVLMPLGRRDDVIKLHGIDLGTPNPGTEPAITTCGQAAENYLTR
jgi:hypothetical protein